MLQYAWTGGCNMDWWVVRWLGIVTVRMDWWVVEVYCSTSEAVQVSNHELYSGWS